MMHIYHWKMGCNGVAWIYGQLTGGRCNGVAWMYDRLTPSHLSIDALNTATPNLAHLMADLYIYRQCTYTHGRWTPLNQA